MTDDLPAFVAHELGRPVPRAVAQLARALAARQGGVAVLYYGSTLRTGDVEGTVLDFYVLTDGAVGTPLRRFGLKHLWPDVSYHEVAIDGRILRAKVATMPLETFARAAAGEATDTTIWARFVQPAALAWSADAVTARLVTRAVADADVTAARFAAVLGPGRGTPSDYWLALFRETYRAELRVEPSGREGAILRHDPVRWARLLPLAWAAGGIGFDGDGDVLTPAVDVGLWGETARAWLWRASAGKALNVARLVKAAFTFDGAARYGLWKINRHTGLSLRLTPWRERHPVLAAAGVMWQVLRARPS